MPRSSAPNREDVLETCPACNGDGEVTPVPELPAIPCGWCRAEGLVTPARAAQWRRRNRTTATPPTGEQS